MMGDNDDFITTVSLKVITYVNLYCLLGVLMVMESMSLMKVVGNDFTVNLHNQFDLCVWVMPTS